MSKLDEKEFIQYLLLLCLFFDRKKSTCYIEDNINFKKKLFFRAIGDPETDEHLNQLCYEKYDCFLPDQSIKRINRLLIYKAKNNGIEDTINFRVVKTADRIYVNLGNGSIVRITRKGATTVDKAMVKFVINSDLGIMATPDLVNGNLRLLRKYIPVNQKYFKLILVFIFNCFFTDTHYVILLLIGPSGSAKSFFTKVIKAFAARQESSSPQKR